MGALRLSAVDARALSLGLWPGQGAAEARAMCPALDILAADAAADRCLLDALADWADRYTPLVALDGTDGLFLDISGCAHLFGGEKALLDDCLARLFHLGLEAQAAIAPTPGLAWALARHGSGLIVRPEEIGEVIPALPVSALRLPDEEAQALARVGLKRIGDLVDAPRKPLARRFGPRLLTRFDQMRGLEDEPVSPRRPVAELTAERRLVDAISGSQAIILLARQLAESLKPSLERRGLGALALELQLFRVDGAVARLCVRAARPLRDPGRIQALVAERLGALHEEIDAGYGFETLRLCVTAFGDFVSWQTDLAGGEGDGDGASLAALADRLAARLGADRVLVAQPQASHLPERSVSLVPFADALSLSGGAPGDGEGGTAAPRPLRLFRHPEPVTAVAEVPEGPPVRFRWRRSHHQVLRAEGPERIGAEWWIDGEAAPARDYYRVEDEAGRRYWLFREGLYERDVMMPRWFMHGLFP